MKWIDYLAGMFDHWFGTPPPNDLSPAERAELEKAANEAIAANFSQLSPDLILPDEVLDDILLDLGGVPASDSYSVGTEKFYWSTDDPTSELSCREYERWVDDRNRRVFWHKLYEEHKEGE